MEVINGYGSSKCVGRAGLMMRSLNGDNLGRTMRIVGSVEWGNDNSGTRTITDSTYNFTETSSYLIDTRTNSVSNGITLKVSAGTYVDYIADVFYAVDDYSAIYFNGGSTFDLTVRRTSESSPKLTTYPTSVQLLINGVPYGDAVSYSGGFNFLNIILPLDEDITSIGYRFNFGSYSMSNTQGVKTDIFLYANINDTSTFTVTLAPEDPPYLAPMGTMIGQLNNIEEGINNVASDVVSGVSDYFDNIFNDPVMDSAASNNQQVIDTQVEQAEQIQQDMSTLERPEVNDVVPDIESSSPLDSFGTYTAVVSPLINADIVVTMMIVVCSFAFIGYVLFGKRS